MHFVLRRLASVRPRLCGAEPLEQRVLLSSISGTVWRDVNGNGVRDARVDVGLSGWTVYADLNNNGARDGSEPSALSAADGSYGLTVSVTALGTTFHVRQVMQSGWRPTAPDTNDNAVFLRGSTGSATGIDFGDTQRALVSGTVFNDANENGRQDLFERGLSGWTVYADTDGDGAFDALAEASAVTDSAGNYALAAPAGSYSIREVIAAGYLATQPAGGARPVTLTAAQTLAGQDFGDAVATVDLAGNGFAVISASQPVPADGHVDVQYGVKNDGTADSPSFVVGFYLSDDATITKTDTLIGLKQMTVSRHGTTSGADTFTLPTPDPFLTDNEYYVGMIVDVGGAVAETDETNNASQGNLVDEFPIRSEQDLPRPADGTGVVPRDVAIGSSVTSALGDEWIGAYDIDVYRFTAQAGHNLQLALAGAAGEMVSLYDGSWALRGVDPAKVNYTVPTTGTYYAVVSAGSNGLDNPRRLTGRSPEATGAYTLTVGASNLDLNAGTIVQTSGAPPGPLHAEFFLSVSDFNAFSTNTIAPFDVSFYLSDERTVGAADALLATVRLSYGDFRIYFDNNQQFQRQGYPVSADLVLPAVDPFRTDNQYWIRAVADAGGEIPEGDETNNVVWLAPISSERHVYSPVDGQRVLPAYLGVGSTASGVIGDEWIGPYDQDVVTGTANANEVVDFDLDRAPGSALDAYVRLYDANWTLLDANDNGAAPGEPPGADPFIRHAFPQGGQYFLVVSGAGNEANDPRRLSGRSAASTGGYTLAARTNAAGPVSGVVFDDTNMNGTQDAGEGGLAGWTVYVDQSQDGGGYYEGVPHATTDTSGAYTISDLRPGSYYVHAVEPEGWQATTPSNAAYPISVGSGQATGPLLFSAIHRPTLSGTVYDDANGNGARDAGEGGLAGRVVYADLNHNGVRDLTTLTFDFPGLPADVNAQQFVVEVPSQGPFVVSDVNVPIAFTGLDPAIDLTGPKGGAFLRHFHNLGDTISFHGSFDDEGTRPLLFGGSGPVTPDEPLSAFDSKDPAGKWYLTFQANSTFAPLTHVFSASLELTTSEPFVTTDANGNYSLERLLPGAYTIRAEGEADRIATGPPTGAYDITPAEGQAVSGLNFGSRPRRLQVVGHQVFYNDSAFDGRDPAANESDDSAIAPDKSFLPAVQAPRAANITSYSKGLNGIMVDVAELLTPPTLADFSFKVPSSFSASTWLDAPAPTGFSVRDLPGGDQLRRVSFTWPDYLLRNTWLQVGVLANAETRRLAPDLAYAGNLVGESGAGSRLTRVDVADLAATRAAAGRGRARVDSPFDFNRDGLVNVLDERIVRASLGHALPPLVAPAPAASPQVASRPTDLLRSSPATRGAWL